MYAIYGGKISLLTLLGQSLLGKSGRDAGESCEHTGQEQIGGTLYLFRRNLVVEPLPLHRNYGRPRQEKGAVTQREEADRPDSRRSQTRHFRAVWQASHHLQRMETRKSCLCRR